MTTEGYILYRSGFKHQLAEDYKINGLIKPESNIETEFIDLDIYGLLTIREGYAWDGPSGPVIDTDENLRGSLVHDARYQLMRMDLLDLKIHRKAADQEFQKICKEDGVSSFRTFIWYRGLRRFGKFAADPKNKKVILRAPLEIEIDNFKSNVVST